MTLEPLIWAAAVLLMLAGAAGSVLPALPGAPLILAGAVLHKVFLPAYLSWGTLGVLAFLAALSLGLDLALGAAGAKRWGATNWGVFGAGVGALLGLAGGLAGVAVGTLAGAALAELAFAKRPWREAARAAVGAGLGLLTSAAARLATALAMLALFAADCLLF